MSPYAPRPEGLNTDPAPDSIVETLKVSDLKTVTFDASQWQLVPKVPTPAMLHEAKITDDITNEGIYAAMLAAAPTAVAQSAGQEAVAYEHVLHMEGDQTEERLTYSEATPFGMQGTDYDSAYSVTCRPLVYGDAAPVNGGERELGQVIDERDQYHDAAEKLADAIAKHFGVEIGEHSNLNCPWQNAFDHIAQATKRVADAQQVGGNARQAHDAWFNDYDLTFGPLPHSAATYTWAAWQGCTALTSPAKPCEYCDDTGDVHDRTGEWRGTCTCPAGAAITSPAKVGGSTCQRCGGTGVVDDGEMTGCGGVEFESGPINCVKDCPDCAGPAKTGGEAATLVRDIKDAIGEISGAMTYPDLLDAIDQLAALTSPAKVGGDERDSVIAGALFDFLGYLTSRDEVLMLSAKHLVTPSVDALKAWAGKRGLSLDGAVMNWQDRAALSADGGEDRRDAERYRVVRATPTGKFVANLETWMPSKALDEYADAAIAANQSSKGDE